MIRIWLFWAPLLFALDFISKAYAYTHTTFPVFQTPFGINLYMECVLNRGGAWGLFASFHYSLLLSRVLIVAGLILYLILAQLPRFARLFFFFIIIGAGCNVFDCFYYGYVIDFINFTFGGRSYGIFNFADFYIFLGGVGLLTVKWRRV